MNVLQHAGSCDGAPWRKVCIRQACNLIFYFRMDKLLLSFKNYYLIRCCLLISYLSVWRAGILLSVESAKGNRVGHQRLRRYAIGQVLWRLAGSLSGLPLRYDLVGWKCTSRRNLAGQSLHAFIRQLAGNRPITCTGCTRESFFSLLCHMDSDYYCCRIWI